MEYLGETSLVRNLVERLAELNLELADEGAPLQVRYLQLYGTYSDSLTWFLHWEMWDPPDPLPAAYLMGFKQRGQSLFPDMDHPVQSGFWDPDEIRSAEAVMDKNAATTWVWPVP